MRHPLTAVTALLMALSALLLLGGAALAQSVQTVPSLRGTTYIEASVTGAGVTKVEWTGSAGCVSAYTDSAAPWWYKGDTGGVAAGWDTTGCADGVYTLTATAFVGTTEVGSHTLRFRVQNAGSAPATYTPAPTSTPTPGPTATPNPNRVVISAAGRCVSGVCPEMELQINGNAVQQWNNLGLSDGSDAATGVFVDFTYDHTSAVAGNQVRVVAVGDQAGNVDLRVDKVTVAGVVYQTEAANTYGTGFFNGSCSSGYFQQEWINCFGGYFAYDQPAPTATPGGPTPTNTPLPTATRTPTATPGAAGAPALVDRYQLLQFYESTAPEVPHYSLTQYHPRQFAQGAVLPDNVFGARTVVDAGDFNGWDYLVLPNQGVSRTFTGDLVTVTLNRAARVGVLWPNSPSELPTWLQSGWSDGGTVTTSRGDGNANPHVYLKDFAAGTHTFQAANDNSGQLRSVYSLLLSESGGVVSTAPAQRGSPAALPNQACPAWLTSSHTTSAMGVPVHTWHRQIDPEYWCYYTHEHGSDPALLAPAGQSGWTPSFGRSALASGIAENAEGFKAAYFEKDGHGWYLWMHFGTSNAFNAACQPLHEVGVAVVRLSDRALMADVAFMATQGKAVENTSQIPLQTACRNQSTEPGSGARSFPVYNGSNGPANPTFYEPWRFDPSGNVFGISSTFTMNTPDPGTICLDMQCSQNYVTGLKGARRFLNVIGGFGIDAGNAASGASGTFYTNATGTQVVTSTTPGAVRQYLNTAAEFGYVYLGDNGGCHTGDADDDQYNDRFSAKYVCDAGHEGGNFQGNSQELEGSLRMPN